MKTIGDGVTEAHMIKNREYQACIFQLDDSDGSYIKVTLGELTGYVGINLTDGTLAAPYSWSAPPVGKAPTKRGIKHGVSVGGNVQNCLTSLFQHMYKQQKTIEDPKQFDPATASAALHQFVEDLEDH